MNPLHSIDTEKALPRDVQSVVHSCNKCRGQWAGSISRQGSVFHPDFPGSHSGPLQAVDALLRIRVLLDQCCLEVLGEHGEIVITDLVFPDGSPEGVIVMCEQGDAVIETLDLWHLDASQDGGVARPSSSGTTTTRRENFRQVSSTGRDSFGTRLRLPAAPILP